jgi:hypothetical protein
MAPFIPIRRRTSLPLAVSPAPKPYCSPRCASGNSNTALANEPPNPIARSRDLKKSQNAQAKEAFVIFETSTLKFCHTDLVFRGTIARR